MKKVKRIKSRGGGKVAKLLTASVCAVGSVAFAGTLMADDLDFGLIPLETQQSTPPANVMFLMDDSGSMAWEYIFEGNGYNGNNHTYPWFWGQGAGNLLWYKPTTVYTPWAMWNEVGDAIASPPADINANMRRPRSDPRYTGVTDILAANYRRFNINGVETLVPRAFYFAQDDADNNDSLDAGELYMVVFWWIDSNPDGTVQDGEVTRTYYNVNFTPPNVVNNTTPIASLASVPDAVRARHVEDDGSYGDYYTAYEELQNFANWFQFYRVREYVAKGATSLAIQDLDNVNLGFYGINERINSPVLPVSTTDEKKTALNILYKYSSNGGTPLRRGLAVVGDYFDMTTTTGGNGKYGSRIGDNPYYSADEGGACQNSFAIAMTDGYYNHYFQGSYNRVGNSPEVGQHGADIDNSYASPGNSDGALAAPYGTDSVSNSLADVASWYYNHDLAPALDDVIPATEGNTNAKQHMITYSVSFGVNGTIDRTNIDNLAPNPDEPTYEDNPYWITSGTPYPNWPTFDAESKIDLSEKIDDLWHASVNGHGLFFKATDPESLTESLVKIFTAIVNKNSSGAGATSNTLSLTTDTNVYYTTYSSESWTGDLSAYKLNSATGVVATTATWSSQGLVDAQDWDTGRLIVSYKPNRDIKNHGAPFRPDYGTAMPVSDGEKKALKAYGDDAGDIIEYLRGKDVTDLRERSHLLGDFVHSGSLYVEADYETTSDGYDNDGDGDIDESGEKGGTVYVGGNDGMLHAFNAQTGKERFAYVPLGSFDYLADLAQESYMDSTGHRYYVDGQFYAETMSFLAGDQSDDGLDNDSDGGADAADPDGATDEDYSNIKDDDKDGVKDEKGERQTKMMLVGSLGKGGRGIFALNIRNAEQYNGVALSAMSQIDTEEQLASNLVMWEYPSPQGVETDSDVAFVSASSDGLDNDGDGSIDEAGERWLVNENAVSDASLANSDYLDTDGDGIVDNGETYDLSGDDDLGYIYGTPYIVKSWKSSKLGFTTPKKPSSSSYNYITSMPWIVVTGNGYQSINGHAVLYVLDAFSGYLIRKIDTGVGASDDMNGLSTPALIDADNDGRVDYAYAGDLKGNMWKFDLSDSNPYNWGIAYGSDTNGNGRIDAADGDSPKPLFSAPDQPITTEPDVMKHPTDVGYLVEFGTGKYLGENDIMDADDNPNYDQQSMFAVWDYGTAPDQYLGTWTRSTNSLSNATGHQLLMQEQLKWVDVVVDGETTKYRVTSDYEPTWDVVKNCCDGLSNDGDSEVDESDELCQLQGTSNAGWYMDLAPDDMTNPDSNSLGTSDGVDNDGDGQTDESDEAYYYGLEGERIVQDVIIRNGRVIFTSIIPNATPCSSGGSSILNELDADTGARYSTAVFDTNGDGVVDSSDNIVIDSGSGTSGSSSGVFYDDTVVKLGAIVRNSSNGTENKILTTSSGETKSVVESSNTRVGLYYWQEQ